MLSREAILALASAKMTDEKLAEHLSALSIDLLTAGVIKEFVTAMRELSELHISLPKGPEPLLDCCGTGGSGMPHFNTSTAISFVLAAAGVNVAKFGGRSATGTSGSFDFLDGLGIARVSSAKALEDIFAQTNLVFLFAPDFYPSFAKLAPIRKKLGVKTIFNVIGPLLNPAIPNMRLLGAQPRQIQHAIAQYLCEEPTFNKGIVISAVSGLDELDPNTDNLCLHVNNKQIQEQTLHFDDMQDSPLHLLSPSQNVDVFLQLVESFDQVPSYFQRLVTLNAGAALALTQQANTLDEGQILAISLLRTGAVLDKLQQVRAVYAKHS